MSANRVSLRYARALYDEARAQKLVDKIKTDLDHVQNVIDESRDFRVFLRSPIITHKQKVPAFEQIFKGKISDFSLNFIVMLAHKSREEILPDVVAQFMRFYNKDHNITEAELVTARPVEPAIRQEFVNKLEKELSTKIILNESVAPELLGGFEIKIGNSIIDASVQNNLRRLRKDLIENFRLN